MTFEEIGISLSMLEEEILDSAKRIDRRQFEELGLDRRSAREIYVCEDFIAVYNQYVKSLEYYGGFEYIDRNNVVTLMNITIYSGEDESRVSDILEVAADLKDDM